MFHLTAATEKFRRSLRCIELSRDSLSSLNCRVIVYPSAFLEVFSVSYTLFLVILLRELPPPYFPLLKVKKKILNAVWTQSMQAKSSAFG